MKQQNGVGLGKTTLTDNNGAATAGEASRINACMLDRE